MIDVVLVRPERPENVGAVARAMANFGFDSLVLVQPCDLDRAKNAAKHASSILKRARVLRDVPWDAYDRVAGTTGLIAKGARAITPRELRDRMVGDRVAVVFGPEGEGLNRNELERCDAIVRIPTSSSYESMNLSHAVAVVLYELGAVQPARETAGKELNALDAAFINRFGDKERDALHSLQAIARRAFATKGELGELIRLFKGR